MRTHRPLILSSRLFLLTLALMAGCDSVKSQFHREELPNLGAPIQMNVRLELDSSVTGADSEYKDTCGHLVPVEIGPALEDQLYQAALKNFKTVQYGTPAPANVKPDVTIKIRLLKPVLKIDWDALYDRAPAELTLDGFAEFQDSSGKVIQQPIQAVRKQRVRIEAIQKNCRFMVESFVNDTAVVFSTKFVREARALLAPETQSTSAQSVPPVEPANPVGPGTEVVSAGDVDRVPPANGLQRPQVFLVSVGISSYRDQPMPSRKYASSDAELVSAYFQALGGVQASNVRTLRDDKALRPDIEDALAAWLPSRVAPESLVVLYFSGQAKVSPSGEVFLVPYEGGGSSTARLYPLKDLQAALSRLKARHIVMIFDGSVSRLGDAGGKTKEPQWDGGATQVVRLIGTSGVQNGLEPEKLQHGLFTYYLLRGLRGEADENLNGEVTLGELAAFLDRAVPAAAKSDFKQEQRPQVLPPAGNRSSGVMLTKTPSAR